MAASKPAKRPRQGALASSILVLELLKRIPRHRKISASELRTQLGAAGIGRELRTIQRHLDALCEHFDIERDDRSKPYGYRWKERAAGLAFPVLSETESMLLMLAERQLGDLLPPSVRLSLQGLFCEARSRIDASDGMGAAEWLRKVRVVSPTQPMLPPQLAPGVLEASSGALFRNEWLDVTYVNADGRRIKARVMPLGLAQQGVRMYLVCRFEGYEDERSLALHRIERACGTDLRFERPADFDLATFDAQGRFGFGDGKEIALRLSIDQELGAHLLETPLSSDQQARVVGDRIELRATVVESLRLVWWLRTFGDGVSVLEPRRLAAAVKGGHA